MHSERQLIEFAKEMLTKAYCPYSHFPVGAAIECSDGTVYTGCNIENASYGASICAERTALVKAVSEGHKDFVQIAIISNSSDCCWPCGICRQMLYEFAPDLTVIAARCDGSYQKSSISDLLSHGFGPDML